ncbi:O-antigen polysaccharide polymerase Wzy [uncultured Victivallis sp.]|uniref:O-antigen polysaccharide polymerase Wzy n=1 Tax=uncultured Victivallis sp. TaxID=354118 RepID=UPI00338F948D
MIRPNWKNLLIVTLYSMYLASFSCWTILNWDQGAEGYEWHIFPWIIISLALNVFCFFGIRKVIYTDIGSWFLFASYLFMHGHVFLVCLDQGTTLLWNPATIYTGEELFHSAIYAHFCLCTFGFGYILHLSPSKAAETDRNTKRSAEPDFLQRNIGFMLLIIGWAFNVVTTLQIISATWAVNSYSGFSDVALTGGTGSLAMLLLPGVIYMLCSQTLSPIQKNILVFAVCAYLLATMFLSGSRKLQIFYLLTIGLCYYWTKGNYKLNFRKLITSGIVLLFFLDFLYIIRENRMNLTEVGPAFCESIKNFRFIQSIAGEVFAETGLTFYAVVSIVALVPSVFPFEYGMTLVRTIPTILPVGWLFPDFFAKAASTNVINTYTELPVGASLFGDFYWNFGLFGGLIISFLWGRLLAAGTSKFLNNEKFTAVYFTIFFTVLLGVRAGIFELFRPFLMTVVLPALFYHLRVQKKQIHDLAE